MRKKKILARPALPRVDIVGDHGELVLTFLPVLDDEIKDWATSVSKGFQVDGDESLVDRHQPGGNGNVRDASEGPGIIRQVWSPSQFYHFSFSQSRIGMKMCDS